MFDLEYLARIRHQERALNIEAHQLIQEALIAQELENHDPFYYETLAALGRRMSAWGEQLQHHYARASELPVETPFTEAVRE
jgi:hypothetical protein